MMTDHKKTPAGLAPSSDPPQQTRRKVLAGRGIVLFIAGVAVVAFGLYMLIVVYGLVKGI